MNIKLAKKPYIILGIILTFVLIKVYLRNIYISVIYLSHDLSELIFIASVVISALICIKCDFKKKRRCDTLIFTLLSAMGLYTAISYITWKPAFTITICIVTVLLLFLILKTQNQYRNISKERVIRASMKMAALMSSILLVFSYIQKSNYKLKYSPDDLLEYERDPLADYTDTLLMLQEDRWNTLSKEEKCSVLNEIVKLEYETLGISKEPVVYFSPIEKGTNAFYKSSDETINISMNELMTESSETLLNTVLHEVYHAYQNELIDLFWKTPEQYRELLFFKNIPSYVNEMAHYDSGEESFADYYTQKCEVDARKYAKRAAKHYLDYGAQYIENEQAFDDFMDFLRDWEEELESTEE